jgi:hypothetical protein
MRHVESLKKGLDLCGTPEKHASGAKARLDFARFNAGDESPAYRPIIPGMKSSGPGPNEFFSKLLRRDVGSANFTSAI